MAVVKSEDATAIQGIRAFRERAGREVPELRDALAGEADAQEFCRAVRDELRTHRKASGIDQATLASAMDLTQPAVSRIERGSGDMGLMTLFRYARALGLKPFLTLTQPSGAVIGDEEGAAARFDHEQDRLLQLLTRVTSSHMAKMAETFVEHREAQAGAEEAPAEAEEALAEAEFQEAEDSSVE